MSRYHDVLDVRTGELAQVPFTLEEEAAADAGQIPSADAVWAEKDRRWALGFSFDFGDTRGVHHIATTPKDLEDWDKVSAAASAFIALGQPSATITIYTETGPATVTALEWQSVLVAAAAFFQAAIDAAAGLVAMDPIPADYADDAWWT